MKLLYLTDTDAAAFAQTWIEDAGHPEIEIMPLPEGDLVGALAPEGETHLLVSGSEATLQRVVAYAWRMHLTLGIIPLPDQTRLRRALSLPGNPAELFTIVAHPSAEALDLLLCNETPVLEDVRIGENALLETYEFDTEKGWWRRLWQRVRTRDRNRAHTLRHHRFTLTTDKEETIALSAIGLIGLNHNNHSWIGHALRQELSATDGQLAVIALAPTSLFEFFIAYPIRLAWRRWRQVTSLPRSWGYLKSSQVEIDSSETLEVVVDDAVHLQTPVTLRTESAALRLSVGEEFAERQLAPRSTRNVIRLAGVPRDEERMEYFTRGLPLFAHASQEQYATLFSTLRDEAQLGWTFAILLILSTVLATLGLFINSASVIIGAMLLAPLMQPIVGLSMGVLRRDTGLLKRGALSIGVGVGLVLLSAMTIAGLVPMHELGSEMAARLSPTILDLLVAIASGVAAAYAKNNPDISGSLVGVAIAVALVPPLSVAGIGIGWGSWAMFANAMLLFVTNLAGIVFAAALTFLILGFSPIRIAKRGIVLWAGVVLLIAIPLYHSFEQMKIRSDIRQTLSHLHFTYNGQTLALSRVEYVQHGDRPQVRCDVTADRTLTARERIYLKEMITRVVGRPVEILVTVRYRL